MMIKMMIKMMMMVMTTTTTTTYGGTYENSRSRWSHDLSRGPAAAHLLGFRDRITPGACMSVSCECCALSGRGICVWMITRPEDSYRKSCVQKYDLETL